MHRIRCVNLSLLLTMHRACFAGGASHRTAVGGNRRIRALGVRRIGVPLVSAMMARVRQAARLRRERGQSDYLAHEPCGRPGTEVVAESCHRLLSAYQLDAPAGDVLLLGFLNLEPSPLVAEFFGLKFAGIATSASATVVSIDSSSVLVVIAVERC